MTNTAPEARPEPELINPENRVVSVWSDPGCPWATLALHTLRATALERGIDVAIDHRSFPLELFNSIPTPKAILDAEIVTICGLLPELGWSLWSGRESAYPVTMLPAMTAVQAAKDPEVGDLRASDQLDAALRVAFYRDSRCISIPSVIAEVAAECRDVDERRLDALLATGGGIAQVYSQYEMARTHAVQGSPHLFTAAGYAAHNPGATYSWTAPPPQGFPRLSAYDPGWADLLLDEISRPVALVAGGAAAGADSLAN